MSKFKVGDRVKLVGDEYPSVGLHIGHEYTVSRMSLSGNPEIRGDDGEDWLFFESEVEFVQDKSHFTIGQTYQTAERGEVTCIALRDDGGMFGAMHGADTAYSWNADGSYRNALPHECPPYRIVFAPVVTHHNHYAETKHGDVMIDYDVIDGNPDWDNAKVTPSL